MLRKISSGKKLEFSQPRNISSPKFPGVKRKFYEEILRSLYSRTEISTRGVPFRQYWMIATAVRTHDCVLCCTHTRAQDPCNCCCRPGVGLRPAADHPQMVTTPGVLDPADPGARSLQLLLQTWCGSAPRRGPSANGYDAWRFGSESDFCGRNGRWKGLIFRHNRVLVQNQGKVLKKSSHRGVHPGHFPSREGPNERRPISCAHPSWIKRSTLLCRKMTWVHPVVSFPLNINTSG